MSVSNTAAERVMAIKLYIFPLLKSHRNVAFTQLLLTTSTSNNPINVKRVHMLMTILILADISISLTCWLYLVMFV